MSSLRSIFKDDHFLLSININNSEREKQKLYPSNSKVNTQRTQSIISGMPTKTDEDNSENNDCFIKFGFVSSSEEKNLKQENENEQNQPAHLVEEINAITSLIIYDTYSKKHEYTSSSQDRAKSTPLSNSIRDDIDRFDAIYSCLIDQSASSRNNHSRKSNLLSNNLRDRFLTLSNIRKLKTFQQNKQSRISEEKKTKY